MCQVLKAMRRDPPALHKRPFVSGNTHVSSRAAEGELRRLGSAPVTKTRLKCSKIDYIDELIKCYFIQCI
jgi:hypothetical protein